MTFARVLTASSACVLLGAVAAACSGSFGSGTGLPSTMASPNFGGATTPTPVPKEASAVLTYGESTAFQPLPEVGGYSGSIAFPKAPEPTAPPSPKGKNATPAGSPTPVAIAIGATLSVVKPQDGPDLNFVSGKGKRRRTRELPARALAYITLLPTHDATLESYPRIQIDVPRELATQYRDGEFGLALWNSGEKDSRYRMSVAELDTTSTPPPLRAVASAPSPVASGSASVRTSGAPSPIPTTVVLNRVGTSPSPGVSGSPGAVVAAPVASPTLPPQRMLFAATASPLKLVANRPAIFALYALPHPAGATTTSGSPKPAASAVVSPKSSTLPASTSPASTLPSASPSKSP